MNKQQPKTNTPLDKYPGSEMTVKAMTREEAIECIRGFMGQLTKGCREAIMTAIPELHKSEDETHRKWILEYLYDGLQKADEQFKDHFKSAINWLEKQSAKWSEEDENMLTGIIKRGSSQIPFGEPALRKEQLEWLMDRFKFLHFQSRDYAITFWTYLDEHRPEGKMRLSNGECADIEKAFIEHDWAKILRYAKKYRPSWKPSEEQMEALENSTALTEEQGEALYSLVQDLKKL